MKILHAVKLKELIFAFRFKEVDCYKQLTGSCSLDGKFDQNESKKITKNRSDEIYCQRLYLALLKNEVY